MFINDENEKRELIRKLREERCFPIINRGRLWYDRLSYEQLEDLRVWYQKWLDAPETLCIPENLSFINETVSDKEEILL